MEWRGFFDGAAPAMRALPGIYIHSNPMWYATGICGPELLPDRGAGEARARCGACSRCHIRLHIIAGSKRSSETSRGIERGVFRFRCGHSIHWHPVTGCWKMSRFRHPGCACELCPPNYPGLSVPLDMNLTAFGVRSKIWWSWKASRAALLKQ